MIAVKGKMSSNRKTEPYILYCILSITYQAQYTVELRLSLTSAVKVRFCMVSNALVYSIAGVKRALMMWSSKLPGWCW